MRGGGANKVGPIKGGGLIRDKDSGACMVSSTASSTKKASRSWLAKKVIVALCAALSRVQVSDVQVMKFMSSETWGVKKDTAHQYATDFGRSAGPGGVLSSFGVGACGLVSLLHTTAQGPSFIPGVFWSTGWLMVDQAPGNPPPPGVYGWGAGGGGGSQNSGKANCPPPPPGIPSLVSQSNPLPPPHHTAQ